MGRYISWEVDFWTDPDVLRWHHDSRYLYFYLISNTHAHGLTGIYRIACETIRHETGLSAKTIERCLAELDGKVRRYPDDWIWVMARVKHTIRMYKDNQDKRVVGIKSYLETVPFQIKADFANKYGQLRSPLQAPYKPHGVGRAESESESDLKILLSSSSSKTRKTQRATATEKTVAAALACDPEDTETWDKAALWLYDHGYADKEAGITCPSRFQDDIAMLSFVEKHRQAYPSVNMIAEFKKMEAWFTAKPFRAPRKDLARFMHDWIARAAKGTLK